MKIRSITYRVHANPEFFCNTLGSGKSLRKWRWPLFDTSGLDWVSLGANIGVAGALLLMLLTGKPD